LSSAWFRIRSWSARPKFRESQAVARICVHVSTTPTTFPILSNRERLEATNVPPAPRRETAAWQPRCFPPLGIDVHGARALCVHRQVLRPRWCPFDRVPLPLEEGDSPLRFGEAAPFFTSRFCPTSTVSSSASNFGGPLAEHRIDFFPREFSRGCRYGIVRLGRPGQVIEGSLRSSRRWPRARRVSCLTSGPGRPQRPKTASTIASARGN